MLKRILVQCATQVDREAVRRETIDGVEHIIVSSKTLPDNIVMNGGMYPAEEIAASFQSLERTLAPVEHPADSQGNFVSANDPIAIHNFYAGAFNANVRRENGRVLVDKVINVQEALKTDRGKRLLDRIEELETNSDPRPIHTSVGVFLEVEEVEGPKTNAAGQEYTWVARNMVFDHDAILLDSAGAAQPHQGVGMAVNRSGEEMEAQRVVLNQSDLSHSDVREKLQGALNRPPLRADWIVEVFEDRVVYEVDDSLFSATYVLGADGAVTITGLPTPVDREVSFTPKTNQEKGDAMKELMLKALSDAGVTVNAEMTDEEILAKYSALQANQESSDGDDAGDDAAGNADVVANAIKPLLEKLDGLEAKINQQDSEELDRLAGIVGNSDKYPALDADAAKKLDVDTLRGMAANCVHAHGVPLSIVNTGSADGFQTADMPE